MPDRASSQLNHACSGAPGVVTPTRSADRSSMERTVLTWEAPTISATGGAAVSPKTRRGAWLAARRPKRSIASSVVAARSAWPWASASAAPDSARVVLTVTARPSAAK